jgi:hypothetical protein
LTVSSFEPAVLRANAAIDALKTIVFDAVYFRV